MRRRLLALVLLALPLGACDLFGIRHYYDDDDSGWGCPEVVRRSPQAGAEDVVTDRIVVDWDRPVDDWTMLVLDQEGIPVPGTNDGASSRTTTFTPDGGFALGTTYQVRLSGPCVDLEAWTFATASWGLPVGDLERLHGTRFALTPQDADLSATETNLLLMFLDGTPLFGFADRDDGAPVFVLGVARPDAPAEQDLCRPTAVVPWGGDQAPSTVDDGLVDWDDPRLTVDGAGWLALQDRAAPLADLRLSFVPTPDLRSYALGALSGRLDLAGMGPVGPIEAPSLCAQLDELWDAPCGPCADGRLECVPIDVRDARGVGTPGALELRTAETIAADPECAP